VPQAGAIAETKLLGVCTLLHVKFAFIFAVALVSLLSAIDKQKRTIKNKQNYTAVLKVPFSIIIADNYYNNHYS